MMFILIALYWNKTKLSTSHIPWKKLFVLWNCWMIFSLSFQLQTCLLYTEFYVQSPEISQLMLQGYEQFPSFHVNFAVNILHFHWALRTQICVYYCLNCYKLKIFHNILPLRRIHLCVGALPCILCCVVLCVCVCVCVELRALPYIFCCLWRALNSSIYIVLCA
jgi:hypothetical protein